MNFKCIVCGKEIPEGKHACVWSDDGRIAFAHLKCSEQFEDITDEIAGYKKEAEEKLGGQS